MRRTTTLAILTVLILTSASTLAGCNCFGSSSEGSKVIDISMGGKIIKVDRLNFKALSYGARQLVIRNTATEQTLELGPHTPILAGDGTEAAYTTNSVAIPPGQTATLRLSAALAVGGSYYLGAAKGGSKPSIRQLFICPGGDSGSGSGGGYNVPDVPDVPDVDVPD